MYKLSTPLRVRTQNHRCTTLSSCGTGTSRTHGDFASHVATRPRTCAAPDGQLRIPWYTRLHVATTLFADRPYTTLLKYMKSHSYPKSTIEIQRAISSGSSTGAQRPRKLSVPARIAAKLNTSQSARLIGRAALPTNFPHH